MRDHPNAPKFADPTAVPMIEAAIAACKAGKHVIHRGAQPVELVAAYTRVASWGYQQPWIYTGHVARKSVIDALERLLARAKGEDRGCNADLAEKQGWSMVRLSPGEKAIIEARRQTEADAIEAAMHLDAQADGAAADADP